MWSTPLDVKLLFLLAAVWLGWQLLFGVSESILVSAQFFSSLSRRIVGSVVLVSLFGTFWLYLRARKPYWAGWSGQKETLRRPKLRHGVYFLGSLAYIWTPAVPGLMPPAPESFAEALEKDRDRLEQAVVSDIPRQIEVLREKLIVTDLHYRSMVLEEKRVEEFVALPRDVQLSMRPPTPYAGLAERLQADMPRFAAAVTQRVHELEVAGERFRLHVQIYRDLLAVEDGERWSLQTFRAFWQQPWAVAGAWTTPIPAYRKVFQYLVYGVYLRAFRQLEQPFRKLGFTVPRIPDVEVISSEQPGAADQRRLENGVPPVLDKKDLIPSEVHYGHPMIR